MSRSTIRSCGALVAFTFLGGIVGATRLDAAHRLRLLAEDRLAAATGTDPHRIMDGSTTCDDLQAQKYAGAVDLDGCTAQNVGASCVGCNSSGTNVEFFTTIISGKKPPGLYLNNPDVACGPELIGTCAINSQGAPDCNNVGQTKNNCGTIAEYYNQPPS